MFKGFLQHFTKKRTPTKIIPRIIPRSEHNISRKNIHPSALKVLYRLYNAGFGAYLVGGCVRDLLLGRSPKDFDIATNARPEEVRKIFKNCRIIGKRFRLAHIVFGCHIIEVATFRTHHENAKEEQHAKMHKGMIVRDNVFGSIEDDVLRRDFSINALYYNIEDFSVLDFMGGMKDIQFKTLRMIGNPEQRFREDPVRLLRAIRFMGKLNLTIDPETEKPMMSLRFLLQHVSHARLFAEVLKFFEEGALFNTFQLMQKYRLFEQLFPQTSAYLNQPQCMRLVELALKNTDNRVQAEKTTSPAFLFSIFLWHAIKAEVAKEEANGLPGFVAFDNAVHFVVKKQTEQLALTRVLQVAICDICFLQYRFTQRSGSRPYRILEHPRFRAGYDLMMLRVESGEPIKELFDWWTQFQAGDTTIRENLLKCKKKSPPQKKQRKFRKFSKKYPVSTIKSKEG